MKLYAASHLIKFSTVTSDYFDQICKRQEIQNFIDSIGSSPERLIIRGPAGTGKSHLVNWMCLQMKARHPGLKIGITTGDIFQIEKVDSFDLIVLDDSDILLRTSEINSALIGLIAECNRLRIGLVITSQSQPTPESGVSEELLSVLSSTETIYLNYPDSSDKACIAKAIGERLNISEPIDFNHLTSLSSVREIENFLTRAKILSEMNQSASLV